MVNIEWFALCSVVQEVIEKVIRSEALVIAFVLRAKCMGTPNFIKLSQELRLVG